MGLYLVEQCIVIVIEMYQERKWNCSRTSLANISQGCNNVVSIEVYPEYRHLTDTSQKHWIHAIFYSPVHCHILFCKYVLLSDVLHVNTGHEY